MLARVAKSQGLRLIGKCFLFFSRYLVASGKKLGMVEHNEMWFGPGLGEVEQLTEQINLRQN